MFMFIAFIIIIVVVFCRFPSMTKFRVFCLRLHRHETDSIFLSSVGSASFRFILLVMVKQFHRLRIMYDTKSYHFVWKFLTSKSIDFQRWAQLVSSALPEIIQQWALSLRTNERCFELWLICMQIRHLVWAQNAHNIETLLIFIWLFVRHYCYSTFSISFVHRKIPQKIKCFVVHFCFYEWNTCTRVHIEIAFWVFVSIREKWKVS